MATNNRGHDGDDHEGESGRATSRTNGRGAAGAAGATEAASRGGQNSHSGHAAKGSQSAAGGPQLGATQRRVINRAVRVLNEIEERIHELREELEEQMGVPSGSTRSRRSVHSAADDEHEEGGQGKVKHPESDRRLKANRDDADADEIEGDDEYDSEATANGRGKQAVGGRRAK